MSHKSLNTNQGHWVLARMGKRVLRPGGKELTMKLVDNLKIGNSDSVVEFAPGMGFTAAKVLVHNPSSYVGVELNEEAAAMLRKTIHGDRRKIVIANASESTLETDSVDKVYGEAMLTMQSKQSKMRIIKEAHRILKVGGLYGIILPYIGRKLLLSIHPTSLIKNKIPCENINNTFILVQNYDII